MARRTVYALSVLAVFLSAAPMALSADDTCGARLGEIVAKTYPSANPLPDKAFEVEGRTLTLPNADSLGDDPQALLCRTWPARPELMLVAVPLMGKVAEEGMHEGDLDILVLDSASLEVKHRHRLEGMMDDDAIFITDIAFDTAFYQMAPGNVAFGLRKTTRSSSRPNPFDETLLWLFSVKGDDATPVIENLVVHQRRGETDTNCNGEFEEVTRTLSMAPSSKASAADILVSEKSAIILNEAVGDECTSSEKATTAKHRLRLKDGAYVVPQALSGF